MNKFSLIKAGSIISFLLAVAGLAYLILTRHVFSNQPVGIIIQVLAACLMIWARITFGIRSFHAAANTTKGRLVTNGPYHILRHPIYASVIYFAWVCVVSFPQLDVILAVVLITLGLLARMLFEEKFLKQTYEEYVSYSARTWRLIPYLF